MLDLNIDDVGKQLLAEIADIHDTPAGAYNFRVNSQLAGRHTTDNIDIMTKEGLPGIDIFIKPRTKGESVHIPVVVSASGIKETVYNDFFIGDDCDVVIVAGCGIDNCGEHDAQHDGIHRFYVGRNAEEGSSMEMEMEQIKGVDSTVRTTIAELKEGAKLVVKERLMTHGAQVAESDYKVTLNGADSTADVVSRSVARDNSTQTFNARITGNAPCNGHTECDSIIMDSGKILAIPSLEANDVDAMLFHEAAIGKIAGDQLIKLMSLGLTEAEAEEQIIKGFLR